MPAVFQYSLHRYVKPYLWSKLYASLNNTSYYSDVQCKFHTQYDFNLSYSRQNQQKHIERTPKTQRVHPRTSDAQPNPRLRWAHI